MTSTLLADENFPLSVVDGLSTAGFIRSAGRLYRCGHAGKYQAAAHAL